VKSYKRQDRVASLIMRELATIIIRENISPIFSKITITSVRVSPDLLNASVFVTVWDKERIDEAMKALDENVYLLQHLLVKKLNLRVATKLHFVYDASIEYARKMTKLIDSVATKDKDDHSSESGTILE
jgi:ribosome-binding factor A